MTQSLKGKTALVTGQTIEASGGYKL